MSIDRVRKFFSQYGMQDRILELAQSSETVALAAEAVGCEPGRIAKSLAFLVHEQPILIVAAGDARIANPKYKQRFGTKVRMIPFDQVEDLIGHAAGGVCPFGIEAGVQVYLDLSLQRYETVFPAAGNDHSAIELSIEELVQYSHTDDWVDVCKDWAEL